MLESSWTGTTDFRETIECIDDDNDDIDDEVKIGDVEANVDKQANTKKIMWADVEFEGEFPVQSDPVPLSEDRLLHSAPLSGRRCGASR